MESRCERESSVALVEEWPLFLRALVRGLGAGPDHAKAGYRISRARGWGEARPLSPPGPRSARSHRGAGVSFRRRRVSRPSPMHRREGDEDDLGEPGSPASENPALVRRAAAAAAARERERESSAQWKSGLALRARQVSQLRPASVSGLASHLGHPTRREESEQNSRCAACEHGPERPDGCTALRVRLLPLPVCVHGGRRRVAGVGVAGERACGVVGCVRRWLVLGVCVHRGTLLAGHSSARQALCREEREWPCPRRAALAWPKSFSP